MLHIRDLRYQYPGSDAAPLAVDAFDLPSGRHAIVAGASGSGKSTLLHLIGAMLTPQHGVMRVAGTDVASLAPRAADAWRGQTIGYIPQACTLVGSLSLRNNILLAAYATGHAVDPRRADALLEVLGLGERAGDKPRQLSHGQRQRAAVARALYHRPRLLLADEPTASLDDDSCARTTRLLAEQAAAAGASLVIATHDARVMTALPQAMVLRLKVEERTCVA